MKTRMLIWATLAFLLCDNFLCMAEPVRVRTSGMEMVLDAPVGGELQIRYFGPSLSQADFENIQCSGIKPYDAYPAYGRLTVHEPGFEPALAVTHADGNMSTELIVEGVEVFAEPSGAEVTRVCMKDKVYPFGVHVCFRAYPDVDMIETWTEISNNEKRPVLLRRFDSGFLPVRLGDTWISHLSGGGNNEGLLIQEPLTRGMKVIKNKDGNRNSHTAHAEVMFSLDGKPRENEGRVIGAALCYGGNYELRVDTVYEDWHFFYAGINPDNSEYHLSKGETFVTPVLAYTYSAEGLSGASRNFHKWGRKYKLAHGSAERKILLNSWEGVYFDIKESEMEQMMADIASMGGELFVMDDGWFGAKYPRNNAKGGLGDWVVDARKLPGGIDFLVETARRHGIKFGIWIEPEMVNVRSEVYEKHPDWIINAPERELATGRGDAQLILDLGNPDVQDHVFSIFDRIMSENPEIDYVKWDANMSVLSHGSQYLPSDRQSHLLIEYHRGFAKVCERIRAKYPDVTVQACASGGGRANWGILPWFDEFWVSDNTDALQRIYIQWGTSYFFPAIAMGSHISAVPNRHLARTTSLKYRIDVAMSGRLGMELQPKHMTAQEKDMCRRAIAEYKEIRPVVQFGDIYRLASPYEGKNFASMMYCSEDKSKAVFYWWKLETFFDEHLPKVTMAGLDPSKLYLVRELNRIDSMPLPYEGKKFSGRFLMETGLEIPYTHNVEKKDRNDWSSRVLYLVAE